MKSITSQLTDGQQKQYKRFVEDAGEKALLAANLDKDGLQKLIERGDQFQADIVASITRLSVSNQYANEETTSSYGYLSGYKPKSVEEQVKILSDLLPSAYSVADIPETPLLPNAEGWFAIPRWQTLAPTYGVAVQMVLDLIKKTRNGKFYNYREGQLSSQHLKESEKSVKAWDAIAEAQKDHNVLMVQAQFGLRHRGRSVRRAREIMSSSEFGLGAYATGIMLLTHPERLQNYNDLWIDCAGDEFAPVADGQFVNAPFFFFYDDRVKFGADRVGNVDGGYGSASGFLPQ